MYKALPPLLLLNEKSVRKWYKGDLYLFSKEEYYDVIHKIISENTEIVLAEKLTKNVTSLKKKEIRNWLKMNGDYTDELSRLKARSACDTTVLEVVCYAKILTAMEKNETKFKHIIEKEFPELTYNTITKVLDGSYNGESLTLIIDDLFWNSARKFIKILAMNDSVYIYCKNRNDDMDRFDKMTIGQFLYLMEKTYTIKIEQRFKGLNLDLINHFNF